MLLGEHPERDVLDLDRQLEPVGLAVHRLDDLAQGAGSRVVGAVDAVAEAHEPFAPIHGIADPLLGAFGRTDLVDLLDDLGRRAAVERTLQGPDRPADRRRDVAARRGDDAGRERRGIEAVLRADDEVGVERPGGAGIGRARRSAGRGSPGTRSRSGFGSIGSRPWRSRANAASADGENAVRARACSGRRRPVERPASRPTPRPRSGGRPWAWRSFGSARRAVITAAGTGAVGRWCVGAPSRPSRGGWRRPGTCRARRDRRSGSRDRGAGRPRRRRSPREDVAATMPSRPGEYGRAAGAAAVGEALSVMPAMVDARPESRRRRGARGPGAAGGA